MSQEVRLYDDAHFYCEATGVTIRWIINNSYTETYNRTENGYEFKDFNREINGRIRAHTMTLTFRATDESNNTIVQCIAIVDSDINVSKPAILTVKGM